MSNLTHCDGPNCEERKDDRGVSIRRWGVESWLTVQSDWQSFDFCSPTCLVAHFAPDRATPPPDDTTVAATPKEHA